MKAGVGKIIDIMKDVNAINGVDIHNSLRYGVGYNFKFNGKKYIITKKKAKTALTFDLIELHENDGVKTVSYQIPEAYLCVAENLIKILESPQEDTIWIS